MSSLLDNITVKLQLNFQVDKHYYCRVPSSPGTIKAVREKRV